MTEDPNCMICRMLAEQTTGEKPPPGAASVDLLAAFSDVWTDPAQAKDFLAAVREHMAHAGSDEGEG